MATNLTIEQVLSRLEDGGTVEQLRDAIREVASSVAYGTKNAKGSVTLTLTFQKVVEGQLNVSDAITSKKPKVVKEGNTFFATPDGNLTLSNPKQSSFDQLGAIQ